MAVPDWVTAPATPLADCIVRYLYKLHSAPLKGLKAFLNTMLSYVDVQIAKLRNLLAQYDLISRGEEILWNQSNAIIEALKASLLTAPEGPVLDQCPEFYEYFVTPQVAYLEAVMEGASIYRQRYQGIISYMDEINSLIAYWENAKQFMLYGIEVIDDAILVATQREIRELRESAEDL